MNFQEAARRVEAYSELMDGSGYQRVSPHPTNRPVIHQPLSDTDGQDPAAPGGPAPYNSGAGPYGQSVATDPLTDQSMIPGAPIPHVTGPDLDTTTLS